MKIVLKIICCKCCYDRIDISVGIDPTENGKSIECMIYHSPPSAILFFCRRLIKYH